ncbi:MAG: DNA alkylation repair protein [Deltaproteobacteria bacterium]|nr:DNA alkylation repair protein [Deltaproteobacteria bacterium]
MAAKAPMDPVADLRKRLARRPRAVPGTIDAWWAEHGLAAHPAAVGKRIALALIDQRATAAKLAGIAVLHDRLGDQLRATDLPMFERLFATAALADDALVDAFGVQVLGTLLQRVRGRAEICRALATWRNADSPWQRRAACAALTTLAPLGDAALPGLAQLIFAMCSAIVWSPDRIDQTAVGWLIRELSRGEPTRVEAFVRRHARLMSRECARLAVEKLANKHELLVHWKRATSLRRT